MEPNYTLAASGLKKIRLAQILSIIATICTLVGGIAVVMMGGAAVTGSGAGMMGAVALGGVMVLAAGVLLLISFVVNLVGLSKVSSTHASYKTAMILVLVNIVLSVVGGFFKEGNAVIYNIVTVAETILVFLVVYLIITATLSLLGEKGDQATAAKGVTVRTIYLVCTVINLACLLVNLVPALAGIALVATVVSAVAELVALFMYIGFLGKSVATLGA